MDPLEEEDLSEDFPEVAAAMLARYGMAGMTISNRRHAGQAPAAARRHGAGGECHDAHGGPGRTARTAWGLLGGWVVLAIQQ